MYSFLMLKLLLIRIIRIYMHMTIRRTLLFVLCVFSFSVHAASNAKLQLNGMASYWSGPSEVYIAALLVEQPSQKADTLLNSKQAKRMDIRDRKSTRLNSSH